MADIQQPVDLVEIVAKVDEETRWALMGVLTPEQREQVVGEIREQWAERTYRERLDKQVADNLFWREAKRETDRREAELAGAADSWAPQPVADLFDLEQQEPEIGMFLSDDGASTGGVFYRGKVNEVHGPSESGKTMFVLAVAAQEIEAERHVVMVDYEDDGRAIVNRLRFVFNLEREQIEKYFHYFRPDTPFGDAGYEHITGIGDVSLCIIDAVTESMAVSQLDGRNENEVATWYNDFPKRLAAQGMGVVVIDHTPQDNSTRQIGSQHKKSAVDGVSYTAEPVYPFVKGQLGHLRIRVAKDKIGSIRVAALPQGEGKQFWRGDFKIDGRPTAVGPRVLVTGVTRQSQMTEGKAHDVKTVTPCPDYLAPILLALTDDGEWLSTRALAKAAGDIGSDAARTYANRLLAAGLAEKSMQGKSAYFKVTPDGVHSANQWANDHRFDAQDPTLEDEDDQCSVGANRTSTEHGNRTSTERQPNVSDLHRTSTERQPNV